MISVKRLVYIFIGALALGGMYVNGEETPPAKHAKPVLHLSPPLMELLRAEMRALLTGVQSLPVSIALADWKNIADTSAQIGASYILEQKLTPAQKQELEHSLPEHFKRLDAGFHVEAKKLEAAALNHDAQLSAFHYYRLIETCTACHTIYAPARFPGFAATPGHAHGHGH